MITYAEAILAINPSAGFSCNESEGSIIWDSGITPISIEDITAKRTELQAAYDAQAYARSRKTEYPTIEECVHAILDDDLDALQVLRQAVKDKYPK